MNGQWHRTSPEQPETFALEYRDPSELERLLAEHVNDAVVRNRILEAVR
ncbi:MAG TPA: hypothetical protein VNC21_07925 [Vicinamibacterales bacterium]|nr:hypothetical protein [Vicinamibacterales bacterium]